MSALPGEGDVEVRLNGEPAPYVLKCSPAAAITLCRQPGGIGGVQGADKSSVMTRLFDLDIDTMALVIRLGLGKTARDTPKLEEQIYDTGLFELVGPLTDYVMHLRQGGRRNPPTGGDASGAEGPTRS
jgi:hypothetical protein